MLSAGAELRIGYRTGLFSPATAARLAEHLRRALAQRHQPVRAVQLADEPDRALILGRFNDTVRPYPADVPGAPAVRRTGAPGAGRARRQLARTSG